MVFKIPQDCHQKSDIIPWNLETNVIKGKISYLQPRIVCENHGITMFLNMDSESKFRATPAVFVTLECGVLESNRFDFWNQRTQISLEPNFHQNQRKFRKSWVTPLSTRILT